jgi:hypothetical protein
LYQLTHILDKIKTLTVRIGNWKNFPNIILDIKCPKEV